MIHNDRSEQVIEDLMEAGLILQEANLTLEGERPGSPKYRRRLVTVMDGQELLPSVGAHP